MNPNPLVYVCLITTHPPFDNGFFLLHPYFDGRLSPNFLYDRFEPFGVWGFPGNTWRA
jgi:hypothetical protein